MQKKIDAHVFSGLRTDFDPIKQPADCLVDAKNIRFETREGNSFMSITPEKSNKILSFKTTGDNIQLISDAVNGVYLGHCIVDKYCILFTTTTKDIARKTDYIYRIEITNTEAIVNLLYSGDLNFNINNPIQAISSIEGDLIQKVYWVDGLNQPRVINIVEDKYLSIPIYELRNQKKSTSFDFSQELKLQEEVEVYKDYNSIGMFPAGSIQYAISYFNKYGQESALAWTSSLYYTSFKGRAGSPEDTVPCTFKIVIKNVDNSFDYIRLYSILRTSLDSTPTVRVVSDLNIKLNTSDNKVIFNDSNTKGYTIDPQQLLYLGGESVIAGTINSKNNVLFLGNIKENNSLETLNYSFSDIPEKQELIYYDTTAPTENFNNKYPACDTLNLIPHNEITDVIKKTFLRSPHTFKKGETYRLGLQFQYKNGKWSKPFYWKDITINKLVYNTNYCGGDKQRGISTLSLPEIKFNSIPTETFSEIKDKGYLRVRPLMVNPAFHNKSIIAQGFLNPTVYNENDRKDNFAYAMSSWFTRPFLGVGRTSSSTYNDAIWSRTNQSLGIKGAYLEFRDGYNFRHLKDTDDSRLELLGNFSAHPEELRQVINSSEIQSQFNTYKVCTDILSFHSPEIEFDESLNNSNISQLKLNILGVSTINSSNGDITLETSSATMESGSQGYQHASTSTPGTSLCALPIYEDFVKNKVGDIYKTMYEVVGSITPVTTYKIPKRNYVIYPWHRWGSLNNDWFRADGSTRTGVLKTKVISNMHICEVCKVEDIKFNTPKVQNLQLANSEQDELIHFANNKFYRYNVDTLYDTNTALSTISQYNEKYIKNIGIAVNYIWATVNGNPRILKDSDGYGFDGVKHTWDGSNSNSLIRMETSDINFFKGGDSVRIKYKSTPHIAVELSKPLTALAAESLSIVDSGSDKNAYLPIAELQRDIPKDVSVGDYLYGEHSNIDILEDHQWIPAGDSVSIDNIENLTWKYGDTFFQRYDCLRVYPYTHEDENQVVDVVSLMCETRVNIDGRYDRNKGNTVNFYANPTNFNLHNPVYNQIDSYFNYRILDEDLYKNNTYINMVCWSLPKQVMSQVDNWCNINLASSITLTDNTGAINSINIHNENIYLFQDSSVTQLLYNSRVQLQSSESVPIEIANSGKVDGTRVISNSIGCKNFKQACSTSSGIYFIDNVSKQLYHIADQLQNISKTNNISSWFYNNDVDNIWNDPIYQDIYLHTKDTVLKYSESFGKFISFLDYQKATNLFYINGRILTPHSTEYNTQLWGLGEGSTYNNFFNDITQSSISFTSNLDSAQDKIFTNLEVRADSYTDEGDIIHDKFPFDRIEVKNNYQSGIKDLQYLFKDGKQLPISTNIKKKFRTWRLDIPRDDRNKRDRIRDFWTNITLSQSKNRESFNFRLHDLNVVYYT